MSVERREERREGRVREGKERSGEVRTKYATRWGARSQKKERGGKQVN